MNLHGHAIPDYELRLCITCGHSSVREHRPGRTGELRCNSCHEVNFALFEPRWQRRPTEHTFVDRYAEQLSTVQLAELRVQYAIEDSR
jgi:hypothetical protein